MSQTTDYEPQVFITGAGPGSPGLLTVRAVEALKKADVVLYDHLVPTRLLDFASDHAELISVRDLPGNHPDRYPHIHERMIRFAQNGKVVVRLKGGDPLVFGRGGEEMEALRAAGIRYEIIPGVTAALATAAFLDFPLTHRLHASALALVTGHEIINKEGQRLDWSILARFPGTLAIYMGLSRLPVIISELLKHGMNPELPAVVAERVSTGEMRTVVSPLAQLDDARRHAGLEAPGMIVIGDVVCLHRQPSWFSSRPLFGVRVMITRPKHQAEEMTRKFENLGAVVHRLPTMRIEPADNAAEITHTIKEISQGKFDWLVFTSVNGVDHFMRKLLEISDVRGLQALRLAAIGPHTAAALAKYYLRADCVPDKDFSSEGLVASLVEKVRGQRVLLARANRGREYLFTELQAVAQTVQQLTVYQQVDDVDVHSPEFLALARGEINYITLTSSNIARSLIRCFDDTISLRVKRGEIKLIALSPETGSAIRALGFEVAGEAETFTTDGIIECVVRCQLAEANHNFQAHESGRVS